MMLNSPKNIVRELGIIICKVESHSCCSDGAISLERGIEEWRGPTR